MLSRTLVTSPCFGRDADAQHAGAGLDVELVALRRDDAAVDGELHEAAHAVAGHLRLGAVGVEDAHPHVGAFATARRGSARRRRRRSGGRRWSAPARSSRDRGARASTTTKSLPVPCSFVKSMMLEDTAAVSVDREGQARRAPPRCRVRARRGRARSRPASGCARRRRRNQACCMRASRCVSVLISADSRIERQLAPQVRADLRGSRCRHRRQIAAVSGRVQAAHLVDEAAGHHRVDAGVDAAVQRSRGSRGR